METAQPNVINESPGMMTPSNTDLLPHFGMSFFLPLPVGLQKANARYGNFNRRIRKPDGDEVVEVIEQYNFFPAFSLLPFIGFVDNIPFERFPSAEDATPLPGAFDTNAFLQNSEEVVTQQELNARQCIERCLQQNRLRGFRPLYKLTGLYPEDRNKSIQTAYDIVNVVLPVGNNKIFTTKSRKRAGAEFEGPFLDEVLRFLQNTSRDLIEKSKLSKAHKAIAFEVHGEMLSGADRAMRMANTMLNESEAEIQNPQGVKSTYDAPQLEVDDAPVPTDLYALAHTNRAEIANKQLEASKTMTEGMTEQFANVMQKVLAGGVPASDAGDGDTMLLTQEEVDLQVEAKTQELQDRIEELEGKQDPDTETTTKGGKNK